MAARDPLMPAIDFAHDALPDLHDRLAELRRHGPVVPVRYHGSPVWLVLDHAVLAAAFLDDDAFDPAEGYFAMTGTTQGRNLLSLHGTEHRASRAMVTRPFLPAQARALVEALIAPVARELLDAIEGQRSLDLIPAFTRPFPFRVITRLLGIPIADEVLLLEWAIKLFDHPWDPEGALRAKAAFDDYMGRIIAARRRAPGDDFVSMLIAADYEGERLDDERILAFLRLLFPAGSDTTFKNAGSLFACVLGDPALIAMARRGEAERTAIVTEGLRWQPPTALLPRRAAKDATLGGVRIAGGDWLLFGITAANSDPAVFADPRRFDPARDNREIISFGRGVHFCLGMHLARRELETALHLVLDRFPAMRLDPDRPVEFASAVLRGPRELWVQPYGAA